jgi:hypothetical protein
MRGSRLKNKTPMNADGRRCTPTLDGISAFIGGPLPLSAFIGVMLLSPPVHRGITA